MKTANPIQASFTDVYFTPVQVSDLPSIKELYLKKQPTAEGAIHTSASPLRITDNFGCPVHAARRKDRVIGYSYVCVDKAGATCIKVIVDDDHAGPQWEQQLLAFSRAHNGETKMKDYKKASERLVIWLNRCL